VLDRELRGAARHRLGCAPGEDRRGDAGGLQHLHPVAVEDVERLERLALGSDVERAVGHHAIDVEDREPHTARARGEVH
jgi:hypothetical protein